ncbi:hypothetical protein EBI01_14160 [Marinomonas rhizomae]|uniref:XRE family transcriptional regulator n=1 Tax=Marinomonas rhizomae TaxID=491948 RepID=A0A366IZ16_9GAMM|nr:hypothetical protein [Marinomonas rhizomae]RBP80063.1 hypothetical protein DFP80_112119 [Marinomonas rhizomae]RNF71986.1 hypothetical protein EBI01_14160 [Marinomonas rhizomae]
MQLDYVEEIHKRIKPELKRLGISMAEASRRIGETDSQGLRDVCAGRKRASAELIAKLMLIEGINIQHILTGGSMEENTLNKEKLYDTSVCILTMEEKAILSSYRLASETGKRVIAAACTILAEEKIQNKENR